jgi:CDGSH-type Zn-finger protein
MAATSKRKPSIQPLPNGPYVFRDPTTVSPCRILESSKRARIVNQPYVALCRCGGSRTKPFCDGSHLTNGFRSEKAADRTPDRRDDYVGRRIVLHDNRGICSHAGHCTSRLPSVYREDAEPWIAPDGATARRVVESVRRCPSGALSCSIDGVEHRDENRPPRVIVSKDGPYQIEGGIELLGADFGEGASREHYCLCRCGASKNKPFCDGRHWEVKFRDAGA